MTLVFGDVKMLQKFQRYHLQRDDFLQVSSFWNSECWKNECAHCKQATDSLLMLITANAAHKPIALQDYACQLYSVALYQILHNLRPNRL